MTVAEMRMEALSRAVGGKSTANWLPIVQGFMARGIPAEEITPRENVFTYRAWQALGRQVRKGEKGVKVTTFIPMDPSRREKEAAARTGKPARGGARPRSTTVFHVSQTDAVPELAPMTPAARAARDIELEELEATL